MYVHPEFATSYRDARLRDDNLFSAHHRRFRQPDRVYTLQDDIVAVDRQRGGRKFTGATVF